MEQQMNQMYPVIAEGILGMIPDGNWYEIYLYAEILDGSREVFFYFNTYENEDFIYSHDIPAKYNVSEKTYDSLLVELQTKFHDLRQIFIDNDQEPWTNLTLILKYPGKIKINYDYEDVINSVISPTQRQMVFEYQHLGLLPQSEMNRQFVLNYVNNENGKR
ncbi:antitoxin YezG family protein [Sporosarcina sp. E16_8]|uniref:antitoxin YezG family protein n=1 Tax=Sporosarcina sp. E16_8 TaxID=2789295 RepID=UPI001A92CE99|nr:antitoxin YezG family protein [Sporosarcina sp. E16_8]MBO0586397.1 antitoxin YezG family protein [Sporosarcina sp. E16_8]